MGRVRVGNRTHNVKFLFGYIWVVTLQLAGAIMEPSPCESMLILVSLDSTRGGVSFPQCRIGVVVNFATVNILTMSMFGAVSSLSLGLGARKLCGRTSEEVG